ncbi:hypothetical protein DL89DRAFT_104902 [Linderina pennispora]|uniref:Uncharacterized protein n=1 Tax=Linderina pennispora TaxID=61395 RepID=A0A1Y1WEP9_9FUNG|nr:uncharacterized protein DL89DRAFT_104902 [Linderina pennispora]ORX71963.1 hypothetical protein DL89DRAFT_104902 [Linderina pennispora]
MLTVHGRDSRSTDRSPSALLTTLCSQNSVNDCRSNCPALMPPSPLPVSERSSSGRAWLASSVVIVATSSSPAKRLSSSERPAHRILAGLHHRRLTGLPHCRSDR